jgi:hypothetical protein
MDLREDAMYATADKVSFAEGERLAAGIGAKKYMECSARTRVGLKEAFDEVISITLELGPYTPGGEKLSAGAKAALIGGKLKAKAQSKLEEMTAETEHALADPASSLRGTLVVVRADNERKGSRGSHGTPLHPIEDPGTLSRPSITH